MKQFKLVLCVRLTPLIETGPCSHIKSCKHHSHCATIAQTKPSHFTGIVVFCAHKRVSMITSEFTGFAITLHIRYFVAILCSLRHPHTIVLRAHTCKNMFFLFLKWYCAWKFNMHWNYYYYYYFKVVAKVSFEKQAKRPTTGLVWRSNPLQGHHHLETLEQCNFVDLDIIL